MSQMLGQRVLLVEDDFYQATEFAAGLNRLGADVAGPVNLVRDAIEKLKSDGRVTAGVLDINLDGEAVYPVADELERRSIPFVFVTGYDPSVLPARYADKIVLSKPLNFEEVARALRNAARGEEITRTEALANCLLRRLPASDLDLVMSLTRRVHLPQGEILEQRGQKISKVYFPLECVASVIAATSDGARIEAGLIGREGLTGLGLLFGDNQTPYDLVNQIQGSALVMTDENFSRVLESSSSLRSLATRFSRSLIHQVSYTVMANAKFEVIQRLARWLLMIQDRSNSNPFVLTHDYLSIMLGVRRSSVTNALHILEGKRLVRSTRGQLEILDRRGLIKLAAAIYGIPEAEYARLMALPLPGEEHGSSRAV